MIFQTAFALALATSALCQSASPSLVTCLNDAMVPVTVEGDALYENASLTFNLHYQYSPAAIVEPTTPEQVASAVSCAASNGVKVQAKGGGHSYASFSAGGQTGSLIISMQNFQTVTVDTNNIATVGAGNRLGNMAAALNDNYARALPHGTCPGVGIGGHASHGGYGYTSRAWGLTLDTIVAMDAVLANGSIVHTTATEYPDLFYALRGAADSFPIITNFHMQTQPAPVGVVYFAYSFGAAVLNGTGSVAADVLTHVQDFAQNATVMDKNLSFGLYIDPGSFSLSGIYLGTQDDFAGRIRPEMLRSLPAATEILNTQSWREILQTFANGPLIVANGPAYELHDDFTAKSLLSPEASPITRDAWEAYFDYIATNGSIIGDAGSWYSIINLYGGPGSVINSVSKDMSAYSDRISLLDFQHYGYANDYNAAFPSTIQPFIEGLNAAIPNAMPQVHFGAYINYVDPTLTADEAHALYYGEETYSKLLRIKGEVDPDMVFWNPQAVGA